MQVRFCWKLLIRITWKSLKSWLVPSLTSQALKSNLVPFLVAEESCMCHALEALLAAGALVLRWEVRVHRQQPSMSSLICCYEMLWVANQEASCNLHQFTRAEHAPGSPRLDCQKTMNRSGAKRAMNEEKERVNWMQPASMPFTARISLFWLFQFVRTSFGVCKIFEAFPELKYMDRMRKRGHPLCRDTKRKRWTDTKR